MIPIGALGRVCARSIVALISLAASVVLFQDPAAAQSQVFQKWVTPFDAAHFADRPSALATDPQANVYVTGSSCFDSACSNQEALTVKYDSRGKVLWKAWLSSPVGKATGVDIGVDSSANVYVLFQLSNSSNFPETVTAKYNASGVRQWINYIDSDPGGMRFQRLPSHLVVSSQGNVYITYWELENASISQSVVLRYDTTGKTVWFARQPVSSQTNRPEFIGLDAQENVHVAVAAEIEQAGPDITYIFKYDASGNLIDQFSTQLGGAEAFHVDPLGATYFAGFVFHSLTARVIAKFNADGSVAWQASVDQPTADPNRHFSTITSDQSGNAFVGQTVSGASPGTDISVVKFDTAGHQKFMTRFNGQADGSGKDQAVALAVNSFSEAYVTGQSAGSTGHPEFATIKYDSLGNRQWVERFVGSGDSSDIPVALGLTGGSVIVTGASNGAGTLTDWATVSYVQDAAQLSASVLSFGNQSLGTQSAAKTLTLTNTAEIPLSSITFSANGDFHLVNNCPASLAAHASCSIGVAFAPTELGTRTGTLTVHDNWAGSATNPQITQLTGTGVN